MYTKGHPSLPPTGRQGLRRTRPLFAGEFSFCVRSCVRSYFVHGKMLVDNITVEGLGTISRETNNAT